MTDHWSLVTTHPMRYPVLCYQPGCGQPAVYKIAAEWSDGVTNELKTYGLTCAEHLRVWYQRALQSQKRCRLAPGEYLGEPAVYRFEPNVRDVQLVRLRDLETQLRRELGGASNP